MYVCRCMYAGKERSMRRTKYTRTMDEYEVIMILCRGGFQPCLQGIYLTNHKLSSVLWPMYWSDNYLSIVHVRVYKQHQLSRYAGWHTTYSNNTVAQRDGMATRPLGVSYWRIWLILHFFICSLFSEKYTLLFGSVWIPWPLKPCTHLFYVFWKIHFTFWWRVDTVASETLYLSNC